ncbi:MAG TPA: HAD family hydrolase [Actinotalea sp.]|jgi:hypothetical protein
MTAARARKAGVPDHLVDQVLALGPTAPGGPDAVARQDAHGRPGPTVVACDLDRTLIYSTAAIQLGTHGTVVPPLVVAEVHRERATSFMTVDAGDLLEVLMRESVFVPCTTRTTEQYSRIRLPGGTPHHAVTANGGRILVDGKPCPAWSAQVQARLDLGGVPLAEVVDHLLAHQDPRWLLKLRTVEDLFTYLVVERTALPATLVADLTAWCAERGWEVSLQGRKLYCVPAVLTKGDAVAEVADRVGASRVLAAGDSLLDAELLARSDAGVRPAHGELHDQRWTSPHVAVTAHAGLAGGQEVVAWLLAQVLADD